MSLIVNGVEISVHNIEEIDDLRGLLESKGLVVEEVDDGFKFVGNKVMLNYSFETFLEKAKQYSDMERPDIIQFKKTCWMAASFAIKVYFLKNFGILIQSHAAQTAIAYVLADGSNKAGHLLMLYREAELLHENFYDPEEEERIEFMEKMRELEKRIWDCDPEIVREALPNCNVVLEAARLRKDKNVDGENYTVEFYARKLKLDY